MGDSTFAAGKDLKGMTRLAGTSGNEALSPAINSSSDLVAVKFSPNGI